MSFTAREKAALSALADREPILRSPTPYSVRINSSRPVRCWATDC